MKSNKKRKNTQRIFRFNIFNSFENSNINNLSWSLNTGENIINSTYEVNLTFLEDIFVYVHYNYTNVGNYTVTATAYNDQFIETESLEVII